MKQKKRTMGFTLAELLITVAILGVVATFTIPKVLFSTESTKKAAAAKEVAAAVAQAWENYKRDNPTTGNEDLRVLEPYLNYVKRYTSGSHGDLGVGEEDMGCDANNRCYLFHNGAVLYLVNWTKFGGTASTNATAFWVDPDGEYSGSSTGEGKGVEFALYYSGRLTTLGRVSPGTKWSGGNYVACPACDPSWFSW